MKTDREAELNTMLSSIVAMRMTMKPACHLYAGTEDWLLQHGKFYAPPAAVDPKLMAPGACFDNAYRRARRSRGKLRYCEGYATSVIPLPHAWCVDANDNVVELTWDKPGLAYFGATFDLNDVSVPRRKGVTSMLQDNYWNNPAMPERATKEKKR